MVMARHHDKCQQLVSDSREMPECVLHDLGLALIGQVLDRTLVIEQVIYQSKQQLVLLMLPLNDRQRFGFLAPFKFVPIVANVRQSCGRNAAIKARGDEDWMAFDIPMWQMPATEDASLCHIL